MICCSIGVVTLTAALVKQRRLSALPCLVAPLVFAGLLMGVLLLFQHLGHFIDRARANERSLLAEVIAAPICSGSATFALNEDRPR